MRLKIKLVVATIIAILGGLFLTSCSVNYMISSNSKNEVIKSPNDSRNYKSLTLSNQLEVLLISDPASDQAAVSIDIQTGQINDPRSRQGLAHFLEHMLFLGTEKYPEPEEFGGFLSAHGGYSNAYTAYEDTNFFFTVQNEYLDGALDRFSQFFISPTFSFEFVEREINAVNSEHNKNIKDDRRRIYRVLKETANPAHPFQQFATGNLETLKGSDSDYIPLQEDLLKYFENHYSANLMKLVVIGAEPISSLENLVKRHFSTIKNKNIKPASYEGIPIIPDKLPRKILIKPVKSMRQLRLSFPLPSYSKYYRYKPSSVISQLLGDEGKGSVLSYLKNKGWVTSLSAGIGLRSSDFSFFGVEMSLTKEGLNHVDEIISVIFQYIDKIKESDDLENYYEEMKKMAAIGFKFKEKEDSIDYARYLAATMQEVPGKEAVVSRWLYEKFQPEMVQDILNRLTADNLQVVLIEPNVKTNLTEKWYGAEYSVVEIGEKIKKSWKTDQANLDLSLPPANPFIPDDASLNPIAAKYDQPILLKDKPNSRIWFKQDEKFRVPKANVQIHLSSELAYESVENASMTKLFALLLKDQLNEFTYPASLAGLNYSVSNSIHGLNINVSGYSENIYLLIDEIVKGMKGFDPDPVKFNIYKNQIKERRQNQTYSQAYQRITYESYYLLTDPLWHTNDYLEVIDSVSIEKLKKFIPKLLSQLNIEMLSYGNLNAEDTMEIAELLEANFSSASDPMAKEVEEKTLKIPSDPDFVFQLQVEDVNSAIEIQYQVGPRSDVQTVSLDMIQQILEKPFYHQLRTLEQLGYLVWSGFRQSNNIESFYFIIQSGVKDPIYLQERIESFLNQFKTQISDITQEQFETYRNALISKRQEDPKNLGEQTFRYWSEIVNKTYNFSRLENEIKALESLTLDDVKRVFAEVFNNESINRKMVIQAFGKKHPVRKSKGLLIDNAKEFKSKMEYYPRYQVDVRNQLMAN